MGERSETRSEGSKKLSREYEYRPVKESSSALRRVLLRVAHPLESPAEQDREAERSESPSKVRSQAIRVAVHYY